MRLIDRIVISGVIFLLVSTPLMSTLGQGRPFRIAGTFAFGLLFLWMTKLLICLTRGRETQAKIPSSLKKLVPPLIVLFGLVALAIVPFPPRVLQSISPSTYWLYQKCVSGWPNRLDYAVEDPAKPGAGSNSKLSGGERGAVFDPMARSLSIAPTFTKSSLLFGGAYLAFFLVAAFYPFGAGDAATARKLIATILVTGALTASIGLLERASWNGKILWFLVPEQWGVPRPELTRALGPFVNPDHFANFIGMIFPLALAGVLFPWPSEKTISPFARIFCAVTLVVIAVAILQSLSRAVWIAMPISTAVFWGLVSPAFATTGSLEHAKPPIDQGRGRRLRASRSRSLWDALKRVRSNRWFVYGICLVVFGAAMLWLLGQSGRTEIDERIGGTLAGDVSLGARFRFARDTLSIVKRFPLFGVGLGNWAEIYPLFESPPSSIFFINNAHNDYLELAAEIGLAGMIAFTWLGWRVMATLRSSASTIETLWWPWFAALASAFVFIAIHELFDFNLHVSANVFLLCALTATAFRLPKAKTIAVVDTSRRMVYAFASVGLLAAPALAFLAAIQPSQAFGMWPEPDSRRHAVDQILSYPVDAQPHLSLARFDRTPTPQAIREFEIATWLQPLNPSVRDEYVGILFAAGKDKAETEQIETSVMYSPDPGTHSYLTRQAIASLSGPESRAVEGGYRKAISSGYPGALDGLASFYADSDRNVDAAELYLRAAGHPQESVQQERFLIAAGEAFARAGESNQARSAFDKASNVVPSDARPYLELLSVVYGPNRDMVAARSTVTTGIGNGVDPIVLYSGLADAAQVANHPEVASAALTQIVQYSPTLHNNERLADFYMASGKADRAVDTLRKATMIAPDSAGAYVRLASAEEAAYLYADAARDYSHALSLEPNNPEAKSRYAEFQQRTSDKGTGARRDTGN